MIQCPNCKTMNLEGALLCEWCGTALGMDLTPDGRRTDPLPAESIFRGGPGTAPIRPAALPEDTLPDQARIPPGSFGLWIANSNRRQIFGMSKEILIGRRDSANRVFPDLDLSADEGSEGGISRRHCRITFQDGVPYVEDLNSMNHTYLNGERLEPLMPHPLRHGDELHLGSIMLRVELPRSDGV